MMEQLGHEEVVDRHGKTVKQESFNSTRNAPVPSMTG